MVVHYSSNWSQKQKPVLMPAMEALTAALSFYVIQSQGDGRWIRVNLRSTVPCPLQLASGFPGNGWRVASELLERSWGYFAVDCTGLGGMLPLLTGVHPGFGEGSCKTCGVDAQSILNLLPQRCKGGIAELLKYSRPQSSALRGGGRDAFRDLV